MQVHILSLHTSSATQVRSKGHKKKLKVVMLHIKLKGMEHRAPCKYILCPYTHPCPVGSGQKAKTFFSQCGHVEYQIKGNEVKTNIEAKSLTFL